MHPNQELHSFTPVRPHLHDPMNESISFKMFRKYAQVFILKCKRRAYEENIILIFVLDRLLSKEKLRSIFSSKILQRGKSSTSY